MQNIISLLDYTEQKVPCLHFPVLVPKWEMVLEAPSSDLFLGAGGFISTENANVVQPDSAIFTIKLLYSVIPALMFLIIAALMYFYKLDKVLPKLREEKQAQEATVEEAVM